MTGLSRLSYRGGGVLLLGIGMAAIITEHSSEAYVLGSVFALISLLLFNISTKTIYLYEGEILIKMFVFVKRLKLDFSTKIYEKMSDDKNPKQKLYIETATDCAEFVIENWHNYEEFKQKLRGAIPKIDLSDTYQKGTKKVIRTGGQLKIPHRDFIENVNTSQKSYVEVPIGAGIAISLLGLVLFFIKIYASESGFRDISYEPFLMASGVAIAIYYAMFSRGSDGKS